MNSLKIITLIAIFLTNLGLSQQINTDRPDQTESAITIPKGSFQVETGIYYEQKANIFLEEIVLLPTSLFRIGIVKGLELRIVSQLEAFKYNTYNQFGFSDLELGIKLQLFKRENNNTEVAFLQHVSIPSGNSTISNDVLGIVSKLLVAHTISPKFSIGYNLGYSNFNAPKGDFNYTFVGSFLINDKLSIYVEPFGSLVEMNNFTVNIDAGIAYLVSDNFQLDFSIASGITENMNYISAGFSWNIPKSNRFSGN